MPGVYREDELDFAGACVGLVERDHVIDGTGVEAGDVVLGLPSLGLHTNGFSLVRKLIGEDDFGADLLLAPHKLYVDEVRELRERATSRRSPTSRAAESSATSRESFRTSAPPSSTGTAGSGHQSTRGSPSKG